MQGSTPKSDFTRVFVRAALAKHLSEAFLHIVKDKELASRDAYIDRASTVLLIFSEGDNVAKIGLAEDVTLHSESTYRRPVALEQCRSLN